MNENRQGVIRKLIVLLFILAGLSANTPPRPEEPVAPLDQLHQLQRYIKNSWNTLCRSNQQLLQAAADPKLGKREKWPVYISASESLDAVSALLARGTPSNALQQIQLRLLPTTLEEIHDHGLLYLPYPYVVPGGRFNEMYGWDSYSIQLGLLRDTEFELARYLTENFIYEIEEYGEILNANRTYYLTRSQPPFLTQMILAVYGKTKDKAWLAKTVPALEKYYRYWNEIPHLVPETGLSRYYDLGHGPAPEVIHGEKDSQGRTHYDRVQAYYRQHEIKDYDKKLYYDSLHDHLTELFYIGDRSMRESGFDPSNRFGPFGADIIHYNPVCLNTLLYLMEIDSAQILSFLGKPEEAATWNKRAAIRKQRIDKYLWDEKRGLYLDYSFVYKARRNYPFASTFYPLWAGIATEQQAKRIVGNLPLFECSGGLQTSTEKTGNQWDAPFGWAPLQIIAINGLRRYGYNAQADRISVNFLSMVLKEFIEHNTIVEKYDVVRRQSDIAAGLRFGYTSNEIGFGWTNAAFLELYADLSEKKREEVRQLSGIPIPETALRDADLRVQVGNGA